MHIVDSRLFLAHRNRFFHTSVMPPSFTRHPLLALSLSKISRKRRGTEQRAPRRIWTTCGVASALAAFTPKSVTKSMLSGYQGYHRLQTKLETGFWTHIMASVAISKVSEQGFIDSHSVAVIMQGLSFSTIERLHVVFCVLADILTVYTFFYVIIWMVLNKISWNDLALNIFLLPRPRYLLE